MCVTELCINYCNEALQQQFNRFVFKAEQAEYQYECIKWSNIEFTDNQEALDLIEDRRSGIFSVLDEQCKLPRCTDDTFARAIYAKCDGNVYFRTSQMQKSKVGLINLLTLHHNERHSLFLTQSLSGNICHSSLCRSS
jgi:myosin-5